MFEELLFNVSQCKTVQEATDLLAKFIDEHSAALAVVQNSSHNKQRAQCPNLWHDGLHDGCGICPDCGETF